MKRTYRLRNLPHTAQYDTHLIKTNKIGYAGVFIAKRLGMKKWMLSCLIPGTGLADENWTMTGNYPKLKTRVEEMNPETIWELADDLPLAEFRKGLMNLLIGYDPNTEVVFENGTLIFKKEEE